MKETTLLNEFIQNIYSDDFAEAEKTLRSIVEEKIKKRMQVQMQKSLTQENN